MPKGITEAAEREKRNVYSSYNKSHNSKVIPFVITSRGTIGDDAE
jgi:hypothetical protein